MRKIMYARKKKGFKYYLLLGVSYALFNVIWDYFWNEKLEFLKYIFFAVAIAILTWLFEIAINKIGLLLEPLFKKRHSRSWDEYKK